MKSRTKKAFQFAQGMFPLFRVIANIINYFLQHNLSFQYKPHTIYHQTAIPSDLSSKQCDKWTKFEREYCDIGSRTAAKRYLLARVYTSYTHCFERQYFYHKAMLLHFCNCLPPSIGAKCSRPPITSVFFQPN